MHVSMMKEGVRRLMSRRAKTESEGTPRKPADELPLRAELYSVDQLERHAKRLASAHRLAAGRLPDQLLSRLDENEQVLLETYDLVTAAVERDRQIPPAAEWLLDNFYLIEEQIRSIRRLLPRSYSGELPRLASGAAAGAPRVYAIALELITHTDGRVDAAGLNAFIAAYQSVTPLKLGELWALPLMLRLALIENLRRVAARIAQGCRDRDSAAHWADQMIRIVEQSPTDLILVLADMARANPPLSGAFLAELTRHLQGHNSNFAFASGWVEHRLAAQGATTEQLVLAEGQAQAADQVSIGNSITSLRFLGVNDWREFVAYHSVVEQTLRTDPAGVYAGMDFATRDRYRHAVEGMARRSRASEALVAHRAVQLAETEALDRPHDRTAHVGYYLVDRGRPILERLVDMRLPLWVMLDKLRRHYPLTVYLVCVLLFTSLASSTFLQVAAPQKPSLLTLLLIGLPTVMCAGQLGIGLVNWLTTLVVPPQPLPRMDFRHGIPPEHRTLVAVPTMLSSPAAIEQLLEGLEVRYLANRDRALHFALLTDLVDATQETLPEDAALIEQARAGIEQLNRKYEAERGDIFYLLHRSRKWNPQEKTWMGYERKRGKLADMNALLRGARGRFATIVGDTSILQQVRYVITLDTDTQLPRDAARLMVGAMAHPLNRPVLDPERGRVVEGYTILQPRVGVNLPTSQKSWFVRLFGGDPGVDPYTRMVSDLYQDMFGEGSFIGKGIYDVDMFEQLCGNFPENAILSHDLLEGCYCRSALLSDVIVYEDYPARYMSDVSRRHRWMRGDWQIAGWLLPRVRGLRGERVANPISALSWWKIFDNLRRSLMPVAMLSLLLLAWLVLSPEWGRSATWFVLAVMTLPPGLTALAHFLRKPTDLPLPMHLATATRSQGRPWGQCLVTLIFLPYEACISLDAILRTLVRVHVTQRNLLEWKTSSDAERSARVDLPGLFRSMLVAPLLALTVGGLLALYRPELLAISGPLLGLWLLSPGIAWWLSRELPPPQIRLSDAQRRFLAGFARKTWRYFETFVTAEDNWLPPDNVHVHPRPVVATRTSPTNIGMALLSNLAACDFGYCSVARLIDRTQKTFGTLSRLERYRGHFYNWYHTRTLTPLTPQYVSLVDSGNLLGHLLVLASGFRELADAPVLPSRVFGGLRDTLQILLDEAQGESEERVPGPPTPFPGPALRKLEGQCAELERRPATLSSAATWLPRLIAAAGELPAWLAGQDELLWWGTAFERCGNDHLAELRQFAAWTLLPPLSEKHWQQGPPDQLQRLCRLRDILTRLDRVPTLREVAALPKTLCPLIDELLAHLGSIPAAQRNGEAELADWLPQLRSAITHSSRAAAARIHTLEQLADQCTEFADMDFSFLYDKSRDLFAIGYNASERRLDNSCYDLLASEARLASFMIVARGELGQDHWFALGRLLTTADGAPALLSWSGSMFEYLMPLLVMPTYDNTLLDQTYRAVVRRQMAYGRQRGVPWGISESGYNTVDQHLNYQYRAFGVPGLGLKRGLAEDLVIAPYATALALMVEPEAACRNLERLAEDRRAGGYGFYEAIDYTPSRLPPGATSVTVRQYMAHHAGMSLLAFAYVLLDKPMQRRFEADPLLRAANLLLQERVPRATAPVFPHAAEASTTRSVSAAEAGILRVFTDPSAPVPEVHLLSNGQYHIAVTSAGGGYSRWRDLAVTRWREDPTRDCWGTFVYLRDLDGGTLWSTAWHPTGRPAKPYEAIFTQARAEFRRHDEQIESHTEISVSPEDDLELRRVTLTNRSERVRTIEVTSYAEVVLAAQAQDESHPAFSNLFVQTEIVRPRQAIVCTRRPRSAEERPPWMVHMLTTRGTTTGEPSFETDRLKFIGRGRSLSSPAAFDHRTGLTNSEGATLDPIVSIRQVLRLQPNESVRVDIITGMAETRAGVEALAEKYSDPALADRVFELAWTRGPILLQQLNASQADAQAYGRLAGSVIFASALRRAKPSVLIRNRRGQSGLWGYGISGDLPIVLVRIRDRDNLELVRQAVQAHAYWRMKGLSVDLVIWNEDDSVYRQTLQEAILDLVAASPEAALIDRPGGIFIRRGEQMSEEDRALLLTVARVVLFDDAGTLSEQAERRVRPEATMPLLRPSRVRHDQVPAPEWPQRDLAFFNGLGGFSRDGREYVTLLAPGSATPAPWVNVIANAQMGTIISETGSCYTWAENSHEFRLTPWHNDPVCDPTGEAFYLRDEETGHFWSPTPLPARGQHPYIARHGFGYSIFDYTEEGITTELCLYVDIHGPIKFARFRITNRSGRPRQLSLTGYWEWVLGEFRSKSLLHVITSHDPVTGALLARNPYSAEFAERVIFVDCSETTRTYTGDRTEFLGRNGSPAQPAALRRTRLSGRTGAGLDPCAALQVPIHLDDGQEKIVVFTLGAAHHEDEARQLVQRYRGEGPAQQALEEVWHYWSQTLGAVYVETPEPAVNFLANGWLIYQTLACRLWARSGFYQSGGAYGFRDQLQDAMALIHAEPRLLREHLLRAASRQFREGDVQHWWHPPAGRGVRTHFSDDYLWLPVALCRYVSMTGDTGVLDEPIPFLNSRPLRPDEEANYDLPRVSDDIGTLYEHAVRALDHGLRFGPHGLPLIGCGDWNDGMNLVGRHGQGESVWLGFFLYDLLVQFAPLARARGDAALADRYTIEAGRLRGHLEEHGWDGEWYRRAYFDDGTPLGSARNAECRIDSLAQSWAILSGAGTQERSLRAMESLDRHLVRRDARLIQLLDPPFNTAELNPGYIKGYVPGVRENGGQYTHGAIWAVMAFAVMGDTERAWELFTLINPITHGHTPETIATYRVEPYVVAADVYGVAPHTGRGGWTWYTGSAGWMYRLITESLLGLKLDVDRLRFAPRPPKHWPSFKIHYRYRETFYHITIQNTGEGNTISRLILDGTEQPEHLVPLVDDRHDHHVEITLS